VKVLLHADGGRGVGLGHASRSAALAHALRRKGHHAIIVVESKAALGEFFSAQSLLVDSATEPLARLHELAAGADAVVIDSYRATESQLDSLRRMGRPVAIFDDDARRKLPADAVINGAPGAPRLAYAPADGTRFWLGPDYQVVRTEFRDLPRRAPAGAVRNVLVMTGGDDPHGVLTALAKPLDAMAADLCKECCVTLVYGPLTAPLQGERLQRVEIVHNPRDLRIRMLAADLAVSAAGQTLYELARCGTPTVAFVSGDDQRNNIRALAEAGVVVDTGGVDTPGWIDRIVSAVTALAADRARRDQMSARGRALIDGHGADRIVSALEQLLEERVAGRNIA
jgi:UDP-2,4-diacetamido-2,4,6-trideoxy-beta-L-altropyranose hydrolase